MLLLAPVLQNPGKDPLPDAAVWIEANLIRFAGPRQSLPETAWFDPQKYALEDCILLPGLINAHCHLELTSLAGFSYPGDFVSWIRKILKIKNSLSWEEQKRSLPKGVWLSILGGTTTVADHISFNGDLEGLIHSPLRGKAFIEVLGVIPEVAQDLFEAALSLKKAYGKKSSRFDVIPTPHSVHAVDPQVLEKVLKRKEPLFSMHLAESAAEQEYFEKDRGDLQDLISERGQRLIRSSRSAVLELANRGLLNDTILAVHGNYLDAEEFILLAEREISVIHCPLSHRYFGHRAFPLAKAKKAGINVALGTDSLASASSLSMFEVLRGARKNFPELTDEEIFTMATSAAAKALKMDQEIGEIVPGKKADLIGVSRKGKASPLEAILAAEQVSFSMIDGIMLAG